mmetsp:Transcript_17723/g.54814  ORF Transcript_17723/g.54814 Transcript_17723/m.54814 type:complete len:242 (-) Transcript_17723:599-1324(-)
MLVHQALAAVEDAALERARLDGVDVAPEAAVLPAREHVLVEVRAAHPLQHQPQAGVAVVGVLHDPVEEHDVGVADAPEQPDLIAEGPLLAGAGAVHRGLHGHLGAAVHEPPAHHAEAALARVAVDDLDVASVDHPMLLQALGHDVDAVRLVEELLRVALRGGARPLPAPRARGLRALRGLGLLLAGALGEAAPAPPQPTAAEDATEEHERQDCGTAADGHLGEQLLRLLLDGLGDQLVDPL